VRNEKDQSRRNGRVKSLCRVGAATT